MHTGVFRGVHLPCYRGDYVTLVRASVLKQTDGRLTRSDPLSYAYAVKPFSVMVLLNLRK